MQLVRFLFGLLLGCACVSQAFDADKINTLPGYFGHAKFDQYSGYLQGTTDNYQLHYWLVEASQTDPATSPLVLWLNGGPGCSSMEGLLSENGPFTVQPGVKLTDNDQAWNRITNVLYLEAPAGVGYSYAKDGNVTTDDDLTAANNLAALKSFLVKFPRYQGRDFYITGESYAGVYVPTLSVLVLESDLQLKFRGIAVGNGLTSYELNDNSLIYFAAYHGLVGNRIWAQLLADCCPNDPTKLKCQFSQSKDSKCQALVANVAAIIDSGLDVYNLYAECAGGANVLWKHWSTVNRGSRDFFHNGTVMIHNDLGNLFRQNRFMQNNRQLKQLKREKFMVDQKVRLAIPCVDDTAITTYMRNLAVQIALHVKTDLPEQWDVCSDSVNNQYIRNYQELSSQYQTIVNAGLRTFIYNGDVDMACNYLGDEWFVDSLGYDLVEVRRSWLYTEADATKQVGGYMKRFSRNKNGQLDLTFLTVRGSGHMVPQDKPRASYHMFEAFINNSKL